MFLLGQPDARRPAPAHLEGIVAESHNKPQPVTPDDGQPRQDPVVPLSLADRDELLLNTKRPVSGPERAAWNAAYERQMRRIAEGEIGGEA